MRHKLGFFDDALRSDPMKPPPGLKRQPATVVALHGVEATGATSISGVRDHVRSWIWLRGGDEWQAAGLADDPPVRRSPRRPTTTGTEVTFRSPEIRVASLLSCSAASGLRRRLYTSGALKPDHQSRAPHNRTVHPRAVPDGANWR